jgi:hypothetical protein
VFLDEGEDGFGEEAWWRLVALVGYLYGGAAARGRKSGGGGFRRWPFVEKGDCDKPQWCARAWMMGLDNGDGRTLKERVSYSSMRLAPTELGNPSSRSDFVLLCVVTVKRGRTVGGIVESYCGALLTTQKHGPTMKVSDEKAGTYVSGNPKLLCIFDNVSDLACQTGRNYSSAPHRSVLLRIVLTK